MTVFSDRKEELESKASGWRFGFALMLKVRIEGELGVVELSPDDLGILTGLYLALHKASTGRARNSHGACLAICYRTDDDEEVDLNLSRGLQRIVAGRARLRREP